ncbi:hypothetical protein N7519_000489 [Penicillium mononematosum]|uniref:uncharacterized protein n=1 Tax=Penicillium mononematosum TaxID=268346 RepID=UPI0025473659|nr:uncharacterized protein N7519_000489 [Penicillium mononematosum]KAJ6190468.1 hypothetical protein N7519_000489 [Penicillium mononematosum]
MISKLHCFLTRKCVPLTGNLSQVGALVLGAMSIMKVGLTMKRKPNTKPPDPDLKDQKTCNCHGEK